MSKRVNLSKAQRFEVFKRDMFTCQYCGRKAPDVILEVDHIKPVSKGGDNSIENLVTACWDCNRGKGAKKLSDLSEVEKARRQLEEIQARKNMIDLIFQWKESLKNEYDESIDRLSDIFSESTGFSFTNSYRKKVKAGIRQFGLDIMIDSLYMAIDNYYHEDEKGTAETAISKYLGIASNLYDRQNNPLKASITYIRNILNKNCSYLNISAFYAEFPKWFTLRDSEEVIKIARASYTLREFINSLDEYADKMGYEI